MYYKDHLSIKFKFLRKTYRSKRIDLREFNNRKFDGNIIYSNNDSKEALLQIFFEITDHFYTFFPMLFERGINLFQYIVPYNQYSNRIPDFSKSNLLRIENDNGFWENGKQHIKLIFDKCYIESSNTYIDTFTEFVLSENTIWIINESFRFKWFDFESPKSLSYEPEEQNYFTFGEYSFSLELRIRRDFDHDENTWTLKRSLTFRVYPETSFDKSDIQKIDDHIEKLCLLLSFFQGQKAEYTYAVINHTHGRTEIYKTTQKNNDVNIDKSVQVLSNIRLVKFLSGCSYEFLNVYQTEFSQIISQHIFSNNLNNEAQFMISFNCVEMIRNLFIKIYASKGKTIILDDEYNFTVSNSQRDRFIKNKIREIKEIVNESEQELFSQEASKKVLFIRKKQIIDQFLAFFSAIEIEPLDYNLDFGELISLRNKLYHGVIIGESSNFENLNINLHKLNNDLIFKLLSTELNE